MIHRDVPINETVGGIGQKNEIPFDFQVLLLHFFIRLKTKFIIFFFVIYKISHHCQNIIDTKYTHETKKFQYHLYNVYTYIYSKCDTKTTR